MSRWIGNQPMRPPRLTTPEPGAREVGLDASEPFVPRGGERGRVVSDPNPGAPLLRGPAVSGDPAGVAATIVQGHERRPRSALDVTAHRHGLAGTTPERWTAEAGEVVTGERSRRTKPRSRLVARRFEHAVRTTPTLPKDRPYARGCGTAFLPPWERDVGPSRTGPGGRGPPLPPEAGLPRAPDGYSHR